MPAGTALASALALMPGTADARRAGGAAAAPAAADTDSPTLSHVVNVLPGSGDPVCVQRAVARAGGAVVHAYDRTGVIVVHSANPDFARIVRTVRGVTSAGVTRNAPL
ncbi:hypothetical protein [Streptomyces sp. GC420]|uniref:hypothetical protein n=1 Tax=Streptomyces sp. GC420 TaxID=2697568 RepID=UPI001414FB0C|nr:hypothetical protein [Streptomyces sp. GC420]NBM14788.1 hypothetical protein [Streptomyces sp. GC420]